jgi:hypothetical protein
MMSPGGFQVSAGSTATPKLDSQGAPLAGGARTRTLIGKLLGIEALRRKGFAVTAVAWSSEHLEVECEQPGAGSILLKIERARPGRPGFLCCGGLSLSYHGVGELEPALEAVLRRVAPRALGRLTIEELARMLADDPEAGRAGEPIPSLPHSDQIGFEEGALLASWGSSQLWNRFFAVAEAARAQLDSLDYFNQGLFVQHCDAECLFLEPQTGVPMVPLALYPWDDRIRRIDWRGPGRRREPEPLSMRLLTTDLNEGDVIMGTSLQKLEAALAALPQQEPAHSMIFCSSTCVPVVAGEDTESVIRGHRERLCPLPLLHLTTTPHSMQVLLRELLVERRRQAESRSAPPRARSVNLIGFSDDPSLSELRELLAVLEIEVNVALIPSLDTELIERLPEASLDVLHPSEIWQGHYDQLLFGSARPSISPPAPYGIEGTIGWLDQVAHEVGLEVCVDEQLADELAEAAREWTELSAISSDHILGFVIRSDEIHLLIQPEKCGGVPLLELVRQMGFGVELLVTVEGAEARAPILEEIDGLLGQSGSVRVVFVSDRAELDAHLGSGRISAVYSEHFYDHRLTRNGLVGFSLQHFERGLQGGIRTLKRLLEACRLPFYRRYGRYLRQKSSPAIS